MEFCGHEKQYIFLQQILTRGMPHHVLFFVGPDAVGKRTLAELFAMAFVRGDESLSRTMQYDVNAWRDILFLAPEREEKKGVVTVKGISVDQIRALRKKLAFAATGQKRVIIIDAIERASHNAQNALLKTLEEPREDTIVILLTSDPDAVLPTIASRALRVDFGLVPVQHLLAMTGATQDFASRALGRPGMLHEMITDDHVAQEVQEALVQLATIKTLSLAQRIALAENLAKDALRLQRTLMLWIWRIRMIAEESQQYKLLLVVERIVQAYDDIRTTPVNKRLRIEELLLHL